MDGLCGVTQQRQQRLHVDAGGRHDVLGQRTTLQRLLQRLGRDLAQGLFQHLAHQRIAVGVRPAGSQAQQSVTDLHAAAIDDLAALDHAHGKAGHVILAVRIHARHLGRLAAQQRAAGLLAAPGNAAHHGCCRVHVQMPAGEIVQEEEWLGPLHQDVVDAHGHQVDADGVVHVQREGQFQLGADAVGTRDQHRFTVAGRHLEEPPETANAREQTRPARARRQRPDALDQRITCIDIDPGIPVGKTCFLRVRHDASRCVPGRGQPGPAYGMMGPELTSPLPCSGGSRILA